MIRFILTIALFILTNNAGVLAADNMLNWIGHWKGEDKREQLVLEIKKEFEFLYPEVALAFTWDKDLETQGSNYKWKVANLIVDMIRSGNITWDVVFLDFVVYNHVAEILGDPKWGKKHLLDVSDMDWFRNSQKEFILNTSHYRNQTGGVLVGPYIEAFITCLWFNQEVARKTGIVVKQRGMTAAEFITYAKKLSRFNQINGSSIPLIKLCVWNRLEILFEYFYKSLCPDPHFAIDESFSNEKAKLFLETLHLFEELSRYQPVINDDHDNLTWDKWHQDFLDGDGLFIVAGTYMYSHFLGIDPVRFRQVIPVEPPRVKKANGLVGAYLSTFAVMKNSKNLKQAIDLLKLWSEPRVAEKWIDYTKNPTGLKGHLISPITETVYNDVYNQFIVDMNTLYSELPMRYIRALTYIFGEKNPVTPNELRAKLAMILQGKLTANEYFEDVMKRVTQE